MAAPRNDEERDRIYETAIRLFCEQGFNKVSYREIAEACDTSKSMVQHYFPKKELFAIRFYEQHMEELSSRALELSPDAEDPLTMFALMGLMHFDFLLNDATVKPLIDDLLESRSLTDVVITVQREWAQAHLPANTSVSSADALTVALGGAYELVYQRKKDRDLTALYVERAALIPFALVMGVPREQVKETLQRCADLLGLQ